MVSSKIPVASSQTSGWCAAAPSESESESGSVSESGSTAIGFNSESDSAPDPDRHLIASSPFVLVLVLSPKGGTRTRIH